MPYDFFQSAAKAIHAEHLVVICGEYDASFVVMLLARTSCIYVVPKVEVLVIATVMRDPNQHQKLC